MDLATALKYALCPSTSFLPSAICLLSMTSQGGFAQMAPVNSSLYLRWVALTLYLRWGAAAIERLRCRYMLTQHPLAGRTREDGLLLVLRFIFDEVLLLSLVALRSLHSVQALRYMLTQHPLAGRTREDGSC